MEAARIAAQRGHDVTLWEKSDEMGGNFRLAVIPIGKEEMAPFMEWQERMCRKVGVKIEKNKEATVRAVQQFKPDAVFVATGSSPCIPAIPGIKKPHVVLAADVLTGKATVKGSKVVVAGGGMVGVETGGYILEKGMAKQVTVLEMLPMFAAGMDPLNFLHFLDVDWPKINMKILCNRNIVEITDKAVVAMDKNWCKQEFPADTVVVAMGYVANKGLNESLQDKVPELYNIGDSREARRAVDAIHEAAYFALQI